MIAKGRLKQPILTGLAGGTFIVPSVLLVGVVFVAPFFVLIGQSFTKDGRLSLEGFVKAFHFYGYDILYTIVLSGCALLITLLLTIAIGAYLRLKEDRVLEFLFKIPLFIPFVVVGHAMRVFLAPHGILNSLLGLAGLVQLDRPPSIAYSPLGIVIALVWKNMALALLLIMAPFKIIPDSYLQAAQNLGASYLRQVKDVLLPMSFHSIAVSAVLIFTSMMTSFSIPAMMGNGNGPQMLMVDLYYRLTYQNDLATANALGLISFLLSLGGAYYYLKKVLAK